MGITPRQPENFPHPTHKGKESVYFPSWGELLAFVEANAGKGQGSSTCRDDASWYGTSSITEALSVARDGWPEGEALAKDLCTKILDKVTSLVEVEHVNYDVEGIGLDVAAFLNGEPECWQRFERKTEEREGLKQIRVVMDVTVSGGLSTGVIIARGAAVAALVQSLEFAGSRVQLEVLPLCNGPRWESRVLVKAADQDLDMSRVIFALAHPSMLRRIGFATQEGCPSRDNNSGYGPCSDSEDKGDIYIGSAMLGRTQWRDFDSSYEWVMGEMRKQGVHFTKS